MLLQQDPAADASLAVAPAEVRLDFDEAVSPVRVEVLDAAGRTVAGSDAVSVSGRQVHIRLPATLPVGRYLVSYRVISADSHPVGGSFVFAVGMPALDPGAAAESPAGIGASDALWPVLAALFRAVRYGALLLGIGGAMFLLLIDAGGPAATGDRRVICGACGVAAIATLAALGVEGGAAMGAPLGSLLTPEIWRVGMGSSLGLSAGITLVGLALLALGAYRPPNRLGAVLLAAGGLVGLAGLLVTGHAATAAPRWLTVPAVGLHSLCAAYWLGSLPPLLCRLNTAPAGLAADSLRGFSHLALYAVPLLLGAGLALAWVQVATPAALLTTAYGGWLLVKLGLVAAVLGLAALNKLRLTPALARGEPGAAARLQRSIGIELALLVGAVAATALLGQTVPPRALADQARQHQHQPIAAPAAGFTVATTAGAQMALVDVTPARPGRNRLTVTLLDAAGAPLAPQQLTVWLSDPAAGVEPSRHQALAVAPGQYAIAAAGLPLAGVWHVEIDALMTEFEQIRFTTEVPIR